MQIRLITHVITCDTGRLPQVTAVIIFCWWKKLNLAHITGSIMNTAITDSGYNYGYLNSEVMFPVTNISEATYESNCLS